MSNLYKLPLILLSISLLFSNCSDEKRTAKRLAAIWTIDSYKIFPEEDPEGIEMLGLQFTKGTITFREYDLENGVGDFELTLEDAVSKESILTLGFYMLDVDGKELTLVIDEAEDNISQVEVTKEQLKIEGMLDGVAMNMKASML